MTEPTIPTAPPPDGPPGGAERDVRQMGAMGDGSADDTHAINRAIEACARAGGGSVRFPAGRYLCSTLRLASHVHLRLDAGARIVGVDDCERYGTIDPQQAPGRSGRWHRALILGQGLSDLSITGDGVIDGRHVFDARGEEKMRGPHTILLSDCQRVSIRGVRIENSANYAVMLLGCSHVEVRQVRIEGGWDGVHFRGSPDRPSRGVDIIDCQFFTGDDAIAGCYWEDCLISGCVLNSSCNPVRIIGPAVRTIIHDCLFFGPGRFEHRTQSRTNALVGVIVQPGAWEPMPGPTDDLLISRCTMHHLAAPVVVVARPDHPCDRIVVNNLHATAIYQAPCSFESWGGPPIGRVALSDCRFEYVSPLPATDWRQMTIQDPRKGSRTLPVWGLYARNVQRLDLDHVRLRHLPDDPRPATRFDDVAQVTVDPDPLLDRPADDRHR